MRYFPAIFLLLIDFAVQVSDKPKGIAVGAAKECVHTHCHVFSFLFFFFFNALWKPLSLSRERERERRATTLAEWEPTHTFNNGGRERKRGREIKERMMNTQSDPTVYPNQMSVIRWELVAEPPVECRQAANCRNFSPNEDNHLDPRVLTVVKWKDAIRTHAHGVIN